ncbi:MAG: HpcH/HpaI aldolase/citrate lyase family protein [Burkholderiaceae bacterium]
MVHPREVLLGAQGGSTRLPVCDHYCGTEAQMRKALALQAELTQEFGTCVFDVTLDCEDGAAVGAEAEHAALVAQIALSAPPLARVAVRVHAVDHPAFAADIQIIVGLAGHRLCHLMIPKVEGLQDINIVKNALQPWFSLPLPLHILIESPAAVARAFEMASHPAVQSLSFGLMDFVSAHGGAIPASAMSFAPEEQGGAALDQFSHPHVVRAKLVIAAACHAHGKVPSHCVVTEFHDAQRVQQAARKASAEFAYTRMWSIHPNQIRPILAAFAPTALEIEIASEIVAMAAENDWAPISFDHKLHDRASYRYFWQVLERAHQTGKTLPLAVQTFFQPPSVAQLATGLV